MDNKALAAEYEIYKKTVLQGGMTPRSYVEFLETLCIFHAREAESQRQALVEMMGLPHDTSFEAALRSLGAS